MDLIGIRVIEPWDKRDKCYALQYYCGQADCPLREQGQCINVGLFKRCSLGKVTRTTGWTRRARKYKSFLREWRQKRDDGGYAIGSPDDKLTFIGNYVWLPYAHINHEDAERIPGITFETYSGFFKSGEPQFMRRDLFTPETVVKLVEFRPRAMFGGVITSYEKESVPKFLRDLWEVAPSIYHQARQLKPEIAEIRALADREPVRLGWLKSIKWHGYATIEDRDGFLHSDGDFKVTVDELSEFPNVVKPFEVSVYYPDDMAVYPDPKNHEFLRLMERARKDGAVL